MDIEKKVMVIREEILEEARKEKEELILREKEKLEKSYQDFQKEIKSREEKILQAYEQEAGKKREQIISRAILERKKSRRAIIDRCIKRFILELQERLQDFTSTPEYTRFLIESIKKVITLLEGNSFVILLRKDDLQLAVEVIKTLNRELPEYTFSVKERKTPASGGVVVENEEGKEIIEYTFDTIIRGYHEEIALELQQCIFS